MDFQEFFIWLFAIIIVIALVALGIYLAIYLELIYLKYKYILMREVFAPTILEVINNGK